MTNEELFGPRNCKNRDSSIIGEVNKTVFFFSQTYFEPKTRKTKIFLSN